MKKTMSKVALAALFVGVPGIAAAAVGLVGDCVDCHTMHNSEQGAPVALVTSGGTSTSVSGAPIPNLLRMDCIACHAQNGPDRVVDMGGGSTIPQVYHQDTKDLAGGNFAYIDSLGSSRKGHNVIDLFSGGDDNNDTFGAPPGKYRANTHGSKFSVTTTYDQFTCAGSVGCHGTRSQMLTGDTEGNVTVNSYVYTKRTGIAAISGAHHESYDGAKTSVGYTVASTHSGKLVADGYRFIPGLKGAGNLTNRWENNDGADHNEYYGEAGGSGSGCGACHLTGHGIGTNAGASSRMTFDSTLKVPNNSMSGFCTTCHGMFHSGGGGDLESNGVSGAFLRHPSDYVIPADGREYEDYTAYTTTAPVARPDITGLGAGGSNAVTAGVDMVMCLSCHIAHGSPQDYMLRFDYADQQAGDATAGLGIGCLACHTDKGIFPEAR
jgi:predicted CXXCH cytochrome family protein